jgi:hypothetical protein
MLHCIYYMISNEYICFIFKWFCNLYDRLFEPETIRKNKYFSVCLNYISVPKFFELEPETIRKNNKYFSVCLNYISVPKFFELEKRKIKKKSNTGNIRYN